MRRRSAVLLAALVLGCASVSDLAAQAPAPGAVPPPGGRSAGPAGLASGAAAQAPVSRTTLTARACVRCHSLANLGYRDSAAGALERFTVEPTVFQASVHGKLTCVQCHADVDAYPHSTTRKRVTCDQDCHARDAKGQPYTHRREAGDLAASVHGAKPDPDHPTCLSCHGQSAAAGAGERLASAAGTGSASIVPGDPHAITPPAKLSPRAKVALCARCHDDHRLMAKHGVPVDMVASYRRSFHYKAIRFGGRSTAVCSDCHTAHFVLRPGDPRSTIAAANLTKTCGRAKCHAGAGRNFAVSGANHLDLRISQEPVLWFEERFFLVLTAGTMLMLLVGIVLDVQRKFGWLALAGRAVGVVLGRVEGLRPMLARSGRRGVRLARRLLLD